MKRVLYTSAEGRQEIIKLFSFSKGRRVAITAFIGDGAEAYLPKPKGLHLICWPKAGGTNPNVLRKLMNSGIEVFFADSLHMKVYWAEDQGAVITSANLSTNALGAGNLKEVGVLLAPEEIDIDRIISSLKIRPMSRRELLKLDRLHNEYIVKNRIKAESQTFSFGEWYELPSRHEWKLGWWTVYGGVSLKAKAISRNEYGVATPKNWLNAGRSDFRKADWILCFNQENKSPSQFSWMFADFIVPVSSSEKGAYERKYPYQVVQVWPNNRYPAPPFRLDKRFQAAFSKAIHDYDATQIKKLKSLKPSSRLINLILKHYV